MRRLLAWLLIARNYATAAFNYFSWHSLVVALLLLLRMCCTFKLSDCAATLAVCCVLDSLSNWFLLECKCGFGFLQLCQFRVANWYLLWNKFILSNEFKKMWELLWIILLKGNNTSVVLFLFSVNILWPWLCWNQEEMRRGNWIISNDSIFVWMKILR
jgi:hypothetical protein